MSVYTIWIVFNIIAVGFPGGVISSVILVILASFFDVLPVGFDGHIYLLRSASRPSSSWVGVARLASVWPWSFGSTLADLVYRYLPPDG